MTLYGTYRFGNLPQRISIPKLPAGKYILRIRQLVTGHVNMVMNEAIRPVRIEDNFFTNYISCGSIHRYTVNLTGKLTGPLNIDYFWLIWNKIEENTTPALEMSLIRKNANGTEDVLKKSENITTEQGILRLDGVAPGSTYCRSGH